MPRFASANRTVFCHLCRQRRDTSLMFRVETVYDRADDTMYGRMMDQQPITRDSVCSFCIPRIAKAQRMVQRYGDKLEIVLVSFPPPPTMPKSISSSEDFADADAT